jgi:hypothetical protein
MKNKLSKLIMSICITGIILMGLSFDIFFMQILGGIGLAILIGFFLTDKEEQKEEIKNESKGN